MVSKQEREFNKALGDMIRKKRIMMGMYQTDIAKRMNITHQQFQKYEVGENTLSIYRLHQISQILETSFASCITRGLPEYDYRILATDKIKLVLKNLGRELLA